jgi:hypothetical protein
MSFQSIRLEKRNISWHIQDLCSAHPYLIQLTLESLNRTPEQVRKNPDGITVARLLAAKLIYDALTCKQGQFYSIILDRTQGKVPEVRFNANVDGEQLISRMEAARSRLTNRELAQLPSATHIEDTIKPQVQVTQPTPVQVVEAEDNNVSRGTLAIDVPDVAQHTVSLSDLDAWLSRSSRHTPRGRSKVPSGTRSEGGPTPGTGKTRKVK